MTPDAKSLPVTDHPTTRTHSGNNMNFTPVLTVVVWLVAGTWATTIDPRPAPLVRVRKDVISATKPNQQCVYADVSKTGTKTIVCGDPAPATLATMLNNVKAPKKGVDPDARGTQARFLMEKCFGDKKKKEEQEVHKPQPVSIFVQQQQQHPVAPYQQHQYHAQPVQVQYVQPVHLQPVHVQPVIYEKPQVNYVQPIVYQKPPQIHVVQVHPVKEPCPPSYEVGYGEGYGGGYGGNHGGGYGRAAIEDGYPSTTLLRTVETQRFINDVPVLRKVETVVPYDGMDAVQDLDGIQRNVMRPNPIGLFRAAQDQIVPVAQDQYVPIQQDQFFPTVQMNYGTGMTPDAMIPVQEFDGQSGSFQDGVPQTQYHLIRVNPEVKGMQMRSDSIEDPQLTEYGFGYRAAEPVRYSLVPATVDGLVMQQDPSAVVVGQLSMEQTDVPARGESTGYPVTSVPEGTQNAKQINVPTPYDSENMKSSTDHKKVERTVKN